MAITLVTGLPGHGKTLWTLARWKPEAEKDGRKVYHNDIPGLAIPNWEAWDVQKWEELPAGSILVVDEAQFAFPLTGRGQTPDWVQKLATHRHRGIDIVVITQNPMMLDSFVRRLVDRHFHVVRKFGTHFATIYEFPNGVRENVATKRDDGIRHEWRYPKEVFGWYRSSQLHTVKRRIPMRVFLLLVMPLVFAAAAWVAWQRMNPEGERMQKLAGKDAQAVQSSVGGGATRDKKDAPMTLEEYAAAYRARVPGLAHTAPIYDEVTKPVQAPFPAACVSMRGSCKCYSQQATRLDVAPDVCEQIVAGGYFVAWDKPVAQAIALPSPAPPAPGQQLYAQASGLTPGRPATTTPEPVPPPEAGPPPARVRPQRPPQGT